MTNNKSANRISLCIDIFKELKIVIQEINSSTKRVEALSDACFQSILVEDNKEIDDFLQSYSDNVDKINEINNQITSRINQWYDFTKNPTKIKQLFFPIVFFKKKTELKYYLKRTNLEIEKILIANRIIKEKLLSKENALKDKANNKTKNNKEYTSFIELLHKKKQLINDIIYLLPTIPEYKPIKIDIYHLDEYIKQLESIY